MHKLNSIEKEWTGFSKMLFKGMRPTRTQVQEMKNAFFAGYAACNFGMQRIGHDDITEQQGMDFITARTEESQSFLRKLLKEYAERN